MALLQISEPGASPDPHQRRHRRRHRPRHHAFARRRGAQRRRRVPAGRATAASILPSAVRYLADGRRPRSASDALDRRGERSAQHHRLGQAPHGTRPRRHRGPRGSPYDFVDAPGMVRLRDGGRREVAGRDLGRDPRHLAPARRGHLRRRALRRRHHRAGVLRRRPAAGHQGRRRARRPRRAAPDQRADRGGDRLRPRQRRAKGLYAVYDLGGGTFDISLLRMTQGRVRGRRDRRRLGARRRRHRCGARRLGAGAVPASSRRDAGDRRAAHRRRARGQGGAVGCRRRASSPAPLGGERSSCWSVERAELEADRRGRSSIARIAAVRQVAPRRQGRQATISTASSWSAARPACRWCSEAVGEFFGRAPLIDLDPDEVVALGAARPGRCARRQRRRGRPAAPRRRFRSRSDIETMGGLVERIIPRNSPIPTARAQELHDLPGRADGDGDPRRPGRARAGRRLPLARALRAARHSADGRRRGADPGHLHGRRRRPAQRHGARGDRRASRPSVTVKPSYGLSDDEVARMLGEGFGTAEDDMAARACARPRSTRDRLLAATRVGAGCRRRPAFDRGARARSTRWPRARCSRGPSDDRCAIERRAARRSSEATEAFAAERMNRGIRRALGRPPRRGRLIDADRSRSCRTPSTAPRAARSRPRRASRSARRCSRTASRSSTPAR